jgi:dTDP-4-dehydrorhamnose 3,5-epimerase
VKLIRCTAGEVHDVIVDIRPRSPTYLQQFAIVLSRENGVSLYVDKGFAQGYQTLQDASEVSYAMSVDYHPEAATGLRWSDPAVAVTWPLPISVISARDRQWPLIGSEACPLPAPSKGGRT